MAAGAQVTLVMPVWRPRPDWFQEALGSALAQTGCSFELVIVDDGNDEPVATLLSDVLDDDRVRLVRIEHGGVSAARNAGIEAVRTPYLRHIDADDVLTPDGTARLLAAATPTSIVHGVTAECTDELVPTGRTYGCDLAGDVVEACLLGGFDTRHVSMLFPTDVVRAAGPWDTSIKVCADWDAVLRAVEHAPVVPIPDVVTYYRRHGASVTRRTGALEGARHGQHQVVRKYFERHPDQRRAPVHRAAWSTFHLAWAHRAWRDRAVGTFLREALALARHDPRRVLGWTRRLSRRSGGPASR